MTSKEPPETPGTPGTTASDPSSTSGARGTDSRVIRRPPTRRNTGRRRKRTTGFLRGHKLRAAALVTGVLLVLLGGSAYAWYSYVTGQLDQIDRVEVAGLAPSGTDSEGQPVDSDAGQPLNILLLGADAGANEKSVADELADGKWEPGVHRSDTMMIVHIPADRSSAQLISVPRDSWVDVPGYGEQKINAAFSLGGPSLAVRTVTKLTHMPINHFAIIDWNGFRQMSEDVGGVRVYIPETTVDPCMPEDSSEPVTSCTSGWPIEEYMSVEQAHEYNAKVWTKGWHDIQGADALKYVRQRHGLPGGDFSRISRQQNFLRELMGKMMDKMNSGNVVTATKLIGSIADNLTVDSGWTTQDLQGLALSLKGLQQDKVSFVTLPIARDGEIDGQSVQLIDDKALAELVRAVENDTMDAYLRKHPDSALKSANQVD